MNGYLIPIVLLASSSTVMTVAWYGHLRFKSLPLTYVILGSWMIAFFEYLLQVPANRLGHEVMSAAQLRVVAEFFTLVAFMLFSVFYLNEPITLNYGISFLCILAAVYFAFWGPFR